MLDRSRSYAQLMGDHRGAAYLQDGIAYDAKGVEIAPEAPAPVPEVPAPDHRYIHGSATAVAPALKVVEAAEPKRVRLRIRRP